MQLRHNGGARGARHPRAAACLRALSAGGRIKAIGAGCRPGTTALPLAALCRGQRREAAVGMVSWVR